MGSQSVCDVAALPLYSPTLLTLASALFAAWAVLFVNTGQGRAALLWSCLARRHARHNVTSNRCVKQPGIKGPIQRGACHQTWLL